MKKLILSIITALLLTGCAASGPKLSTVVADIPELSSELSRIYFYRTSQAFGSGMRQEISVDGNVVGKSISGGVFYTDVSPGAHKVTIPVQLYSGESSLDLKLQSGEIAYVRTWVGGSGAAGRTNLTIESAEKARGEIIDLAFTGNL